MRLNTGVSTTRPQGDRRCSRRDLTLVLDSSDSVGVSDWSKLTSFLTGLLVDLRRRGAVSRVAVVTFADRAQVALPLIDRDVTHLTSLLTSLPLNSGNKRNVSGALRLTRTSVRQSISVLCSRPSLLGGRIKRCPPSVCPSVCPSRKCASYNFRLFAIFAKNYQS